MTMVIRGEPVSLASKPVQASGLSVRPATRLFNAELDLDDGTDVPRPYLAETLPQINTDDWRVLPDGRMETTYRLKPNLTWHDGTALSASDFVFAFQVFVSPEFGQSTSTPIGQIEEVNAVDDRTIMIKWKRPFPDAGSLRDTFQPLPRHILQAPFERQDPEAFVNLPYWGTEYVGLGPYQLVRWEPGAAIEGAAFPGHVLGRPKIDRVVVRFISDENIVLSNVLTGEAQFTAFQTLRYEHSQVLKNQWGANAGTVIMIPVQLRFIHIQLRPEVAQPRSLLDLRARRALVHGIDRKGIDEGLFNGEGIGTETFLPKTLRYWPDIDRAVAKYPYDARRVDQLWTELGYRKGGDGIYASDQGERLSLDFWGDVGSAFEKEQATIAEGWRQLGIETNLSTVPVVQFRNGQLRNSFHAMYTTAGPASTPDAMRMMTTGNIATANNGWTGSNRGSWSNGDYDRNWDLFTTTLDPQQRINHLIEMEKLLADNLGLVMLFHNPSVVTHQRSVVGPDPKAPHDLVVWNIHEWEMR